ncbi:MAG: inositol monophosphatase family protein [Gammaproteobacteria bacterium]|nr:inositol monophosphatase family protein [Gammaproteobacteria bacterium]
MNPMVNIAVRAARNAGNIIIRSANQIDTLKIAEKSQNDYVSEVDHKAEQEIIKVINKAYPAHSILAEESGASGKGDYQWIIDPLDGTTNFLHGFPQFAVSIALKFKDQLEVAVIYDPMRDELFTASRGQGAQLNGRRIRVSPRRTLKGALLGTGIPFREHQNLEDYLETMKVLLPGTAGVRRAGSAALDLAYVAAGRLDAFWEYELNAWDIAAGCLLIQEAGGVVTDMSGNKDVLESGNVLTGNINIHQDMLKRLQTLS